VPFLHRREALRRRAREALDLLSVRFHLDHRVGELTLGERQLVEIARLIARDARILILDEPTATLSDVEIERLFAVLGTLAAQGRSVLYITHRLGEVFEACTTVTVLRNGEHIATRSTRDMQRRELIELMLGRSFGDMYPRPGESGEARDALVIRDLRVPGAVEGFWADVPRGKILCLAGQVGSGATAVTRALAGLVPDATGSVLLDGAPLPLRSAAACAARGVAFVSEDRAAEGLFHRPVLENLVATRWTEHTRFGCLSWRRVTDTARELARKVRVDASRLSADVFDLSGGNQQKLLFARAARLQKGGLLLLNEPTRGVDVGARAEIYRLMREFCDSGYALVMTSSDLEEVVGMADIVVTMYRGRMVGRYERDSISMSQILFDITHPAPAGLAA
jgi:ribose transport system ATP-binding protein/rhamnose transport system ATP-binding protein